MHYLTVDCDTSLNEEKVVVVVSMTSINHQVSGSEAMLALSFSTLL